MSLLDALGTAAGAVGTGIKDAAQWAYNQSPAVTAAKNQQATLQRQQTAATAAQVQRDYENQLQAARDGGIPAEIVKGPGNASAFTTRTQNPAAQGAGQTITDPSGRKTYYPTQAEKDLASGKTYIPTGLMADLHKANGWDGLTPVTQAQSHELAMAVNEAQPKDEPSHIDTSGKFRGPDGKPAAVIIGDKTGTVRMLNLSGAQQRQSSPGAAPGGPFDMSDDPGQPGQSAAAPAQQSSAFSFAPAENAPKSLRFEPSTNDAGDVTMQGFDPETGERKSSQTTKGIGPRRKDPTDPNAPKPMSAANARAIVQNKAKALSDAQEAYTKESADAITDEDHKAANDNLRSSQQQAQLNYESELSAATGKEIPHNNWADAGASTPVRPKAVTATPATPVAAPAAAAAPAKAAAAPVAAAAAPLKYATNKKTGQRLVLKGGQWVPTTAR